MSLIKLGFQIGVVVFAAEMTHALLNGVALGIIKALKRHAKEQSSDKVTKMPKKEQ